MRLQYTLAEIAGFMGARLIGNGGGSIVKRIFHDTRKISSGQDGLFIAFPGDGEHGANFIFDAWEKGVRYFVLPEGINIPELAESSFVVVRDPLRSLQQFAHKHRLSFSYPVVAITGSYGKTVFKEWAFNLLSHKLRVIRSPKSYNSQLGVALSLLEMHADADVALIEAGISEPGEMERLEHIIEPTLGIFTAFGTAHRHGFESAEQHLSEKLQLFRHTVLSFISSSIDLSPSQLASVAGIQPKPIEHDRFSPGFFPMLGLLRELALDFDFTEEEINNSLDSLPQIALRLETFAGKNNNLLINDTYNLDIDALREALQYQKRLAGNRKKIAIIGGADQDLRTRISELMHDFPETSLKLIDDGENIAWEDIHDSVVLIKGQRDAHLERQVIRGKEQTHSTVVEINLSAIRQNVATIRKKLSTGTKVLAMVKASGYGSGAERVASFLDKNGADLFGVAFIDEGIALRKAGIEKPVIIMNADGESLENLTEFNLEPAVYSFRQLDEVITQLLYEGKTDYPIHLKFDTGMNRLGFESEDVDRILSIVQAQPEIRIAGIYSHLADADNAQSEDFTRMQIAKFSAIREKVMTYYPDIVSHLANSEGALRYPEAHFDAVRLGIALYGYTENNQALQPAISWHSSISQIKSVGAGETIGYGRSYTATSDMTIAVIPVGYADGFRRCLSNGAGSVVINAKKCPVVGRVCMDMIMVDVTEVNAREGMKAEIIGVQQTMEDFAGQLNTIPYEVMTGMSARMHRIYVEE